MYRSCSHICAIKGLSVYPLSDISYHTPQKALSSLRVVYINHGYSCIQDAISPAVILQHLGDGRCGTCSLV